MRCVTDLVTEAATSRQRGLAALVLTTKSIEKHFLHDGSSAKTKFAVRNVFDFLLTYHSTILDAHPNNYHRRMVLEYKDYHNVPVDGILSFHCKTDKY